MNTLTLQEAASFLKIHPVTLSVKAAAGEIHGAKVGKRWVFVDVDLIDYIRSQYKARALQGERKETLCHSTNAKTRPSGGSKSPSVDDQYNTVLGLATKSKPRNTMTR
ncbi:helix-turn-helix domain-containing protein [Methylophilus sp. 5]|uniref:helix-turn-helix domain-containing protein n=1 Tax=Methylophilus sp. 5 TaxID=1112274 RepID=UPI0018DED6AC